MRAAAEHDGIFVKAYAGTTGVLLAFDVREHRRAGLLGFAIRRKGGNRPPHFLPAMMPFPGVPHQDGALIGTDTAPVQKFRWSDYRVFPGMRYTYTVHPVYGRPETLELAPGPTVAVTTSSVTEGEHRIVFNRAAAASQAFSRAFPQVKDAIDATPRGQEVALPPEALAWLSRGALEQITGFCARASDPTWALDVAIYEYELPAIVDAMKAARARGADVRIVYHAKPRDRQTSENEHSLRGWPAAAKRARVTSRICHDKFIVLSRIEGEQRVPSAVLCGSTNFTSNGVYRQANVVHVLERPDVARTYLGLFEVLFGGATPTQTKAWVDANNPLSTDAPLVVGFSPRSGGVDLDLFVSELGRARRDVLFCTAFRLPDAILDALLGEPNDPILRLGLQNQRSRITGFHRDRAASFNATALLDTGLDGYLKESLAGQRGSILIHTKLLVIDFTSDAPTVISGSHNLSPTASSGNDENYLIVRGDSDVADCYGVELMRLYDHYRFRWQARRRPAPDDPPDPCPRPRGRLCPDDRWADPYFQARSLEAADRLRFAGVPE